MRVIESGYSYTDQTVHFRLPLGGPFALWYRSARVPGFRPSLRARVPLTGAEPPRDLRRLEVSTSLDGFRERTKYKAEPHLAHTVAASSPAEVKVRVTYRFKKGETTSERRLALGRPDPRALGLGGLLLEGVPVVDHRVVRFADGGAAPIREGRRGLPMARARGALYVVRDGQVVGVHDAISGRRLWYGDEDGRRLVGPDGSGLELTRFPTGVELRWRGRKTVLEIDGWLRAVRTPAGTAEFEFDEGGLLTRIREGEREERAAYDGDGRLRELRRGDARLAFVRTPLPDGYRAAVSDGLTVDRRSEIRFVDGAVHREERCCGHGPTRVVQERDAVTVHRPDGTRVTRSGRGGARSVTTTLPSGAIRSFRTTRSVGPEETTQVVEAGGERWTVRRDGESGVVEWRSPGGRMRRLEMDEEDRVAEHRDWDGTVRRYRWDSRGVTIDGPRGRRRLEPDLTGGTMESSALGPRSFSFDEGGLRVERSGLVVVVREGRVTVGGRPWLERLQRGPEALVMHGPHRLAGSITDGGTETVESEGSLVVERGMDERPLRMKGAGVDRTFEWEHGRLVRAATPTFRFHATWDGSELCAVSQEGDAGSGQVSFERDSEGGLTAVTILDQRFGVKSEDGVIVGLGPATWELDPRAIRPSTMRAGGAAQHHRYDEWGRRVETRVTHGGREVLALRWDYDAAGRVASLAIGNDLRRYRYDGELLVGVEGDEPESAAYQDGRLVALNGIEVALDPVGRPTAVDDRPVGMTPGGRISSVPLVDGTVGLGYNGAGELTSIEAPGGSTTIARDALGRPVRIDGPEGSFGLVWGPEGLVARIGGDGRVLERYLRRPGHRIPDLILGEGSTRMVVTDHLGSPVALVDVETGEVERSSWSAFGIRRSGTSLIGYAGAIQLSREPDVLDMGARSYLPGVARWAQWDPLLHRGGGTDLYGYAAGDPVNHVDPTGTTVEVCRDHEGLRHRWIKTDTYEAGQDLVQSGQWYERGFITEWVDHTGRAGTKYEKYSCEIVEDVSEDCVNRRIKPGTDIGVYLFQPMYRTFRVGNTGVDVPLPRICWNVVGDVIADCKILRGEEPSLMCRGMPALPPPEPDYTPDLDYTPDYESMQTPDMDHTPDLGYTPLDGGGG